MMRNVSAELVAAWLGATAVAAATMVSYAYTVFETKENNVLRGTSIEKRLDRIEDKLDQLMHK